MRRKVYYLFGFIPIWVVKTHVDEDAMYEALAKRFAEELDRAVRARS